MYRMKDPVSHPAFLQRIKECQGDVIFVTAQGNELNLKSALSQLLFAACFTRPKLLRGARIRLVEESDRVLLQEFLQETE